VIITTTDHPFYTDSGEWILAGDLQIGDAVVSADGDFGTVDAVVITNGTAEVYNLTVDEAHTYFVGDGAWLVHNSCLTKGGNDNIDYRRRASVEGMLERPDGTVRVGRWMSADEYNKMNVPDGRVQASNNHASTYASFGGPDTFKPQNSTDIYVEFDILANSPWWVTKEDGWVAIFTPGSHNANTWKKYRGEQEEVLEMPIATNIVKVR